MSRSHRSHAVSYVCDFGITGTTEVQSRSFASEREARAFASRWESSAVTSGGRWAEVSQGECGAISTRTAAYVARIGR